MKNKCPSSINFIFLLGFLTFLYVMFMGPLATATYKAFKEDNFQEFSDSIILSIRNKLEHIFKNIK
jgi:hypothetical protein